MAIQTPERTSGLGPTKRQQVRLPVWLWHALQARAQNELCTPSDLIRRAVMGEFFSRSNAQHMSTISQVSERPSDEASR